MKEEVHRPGINLALDSYFESLQKAGITWDNRSIMKAIRTFLVLTKEPDRDIYALDAEYFEKNGEKLTKLVKGFRDMYKSL